VGEGLRRREDGDGLLGGPDRRRERARQVERGHAVPGQIGGARAVALLREQAGVRRVQPDPLTGQQVRVDRFLQEGVPEGVPVVPVRHDHVMRHRLAQCLLDLRRRQADGRPEQRVRHTTACDGGHPCDVLDAGREPLEPREQDVGQLLGQRDAAAPSGERVVGGRQQFLRVVGVALGPAPDVLDHGLGNVAAVQHAEVVAELRDVERLHVEPLDPRQPDQLGEQRPQGVTAMQVVRAVRAHDEQPLVREPGQHEPQQVAGRRVGPVQVLEHEQHRRHAVAHRMDRLEDGFVQRHAIAAVVGGRLLDPAGHAIEHGTFRRDRADGGGRRASDVVRIREITRASDRCERLPEGEVGEAARAEVDAVTDDGDHVALLRPAHELRRKPGLAHARVPGHEHACGRARDRRLEQILEAGEFAGPADERRVGCDRRHGRNGGTDHRQSRYRSEHADRRRSAHACRWRRAMLSRILAGWKARWPRPASRASRAGDRRGDQSRASRSRR
jgi:hypothetical protein